MIEELKAFGIWQSALIIGLILAAAIWMYMTIKRGSWAVISVNDKIKWGIIWFMVVSAIVAAIIYG